MSELDPQSMYLLALVGGLRTTHSQGLCPQALYICGSPSPSRRHGTHPETKLTLWSDRMRNRTGLSLRQYFERSWMAFTRVARLGLFSWKRSPPRSTISTRFSMASCRTSSNARNESSRRVSSFSQTPWRVVSWAKTGSETSRLSIASCGCRG